MSRQRYFSSAPLSPVEVRALIDPAMLVEFEAEALLQDQPSPGTS